MLCATAGDLKSSGVADIVGRKAVEISAIGTYLQLADFNISSTE
jgi:hypothetical protein